MYDLPGHLEKFRRNTNLGLGGRDDSILVCMEKEKIKTIVTHDQDFKRIDDIIVIDPMKAEID